MGEFGNAVYQLFIYLFTFCAEKLFKIMTFCIPGSQPQICCSSKSAEVKEGLKREGTKEIARIKRKKKEKTSFTAEWWEKS